MEPVPVSDDEFASCSLHSVYPGLSCPLVCKSGLAVIVLHFSLFLRVLPNNFCVLQSLGLCFLHLFLNLFLFI